MSKQAEPGSKKIPLTQDKYAIVDAEDYGRLSNLNVIAFGNEGEFTEKWRDILRNKLHWRELQFAIICEATFEACDLIDRQKAEYIAKDKRIEKLEAGLKDIINPGVDILVVDYNNIAKRALTKGEVENDSPM